MSILSQIFVTVRTARLVFFFFFNDTATTEIYTLSLHDALPIYITYSNTGSGAQYLDSPGAKAMSVWFDILSSTRHWEMEPFFDIDNGRGLALEDSDYLVYIEKPGPIELIVERHSYDILWIN